MTSGPSSTPAPAPRWPTPAAAPPTAPGGHRTRPRRPQRPVARLVPPLHGPVTRRPARDRPTRSQLTHHQLHRDQAPLSAGRIGRATARPRPAPVGRPASARRGRPAGLARGWPVPPGSPRPAGSSASRLQRPGRAGASSDSGSQAAVTNRYLEMNTNRRSGAHSGLLGLGRRSPHRNIMEGSSQPYRVVMPPAVSPWAGSWAGSDAHWCSQVGCVRLSRPRPPLRIPGRETACAWPWTARKRRR